MGQNKNYLLINGTRYRKEKTTGKEEDKTTTYLFYKWRGVIARSEFLPLNISLLFTMSTLK
jgi:hypothetical protein